LDFSGTKIRPNNMMDQVQGFSDDVQKKYMDRQTELQLVRKWLTFKQTNARCLYQYCPFQVLKLGFQKTT